MSSKNLKRRVQTAPPDGRESKRRKKKKRLVDLSRIPPRMVYAFGITAAIVIVVIMSFTLFFNVRQADIKGCELYSYDQVLVMSGVSNSTNLLRMNTDIVEKRLVEGLPYIEEAKVSKHFPDSIDITLTEAEQKACLDDDGRYMIVSTKGIVLETERKSAVAGLPVIKGFEPEDNITPGTELRSKDNLKAKIIKTLLGSLDELEMTKVSEIDITDRTNIILRYDNRIDIYIGSSYDMEYKLEEIKAVIDKGINDSFKGMLRYNGTDSGISAIPESSANARAEAKAKKNAKKTEKQQKKTEQTAETPPEQTEGTPEQGQEGYTDDAAYQEGQDNEDYQDYSDNAEPAAVTEAPAVTAAPIETEPPPPETTTWAGW